MSNNKLFKIPFGFYEENNQLISKRTQIEELLANINANADSNAQLDEEQQKEIESNKETINQEIDRSTNVDEQFVKDLEMEVSERKRMGSILNTKIDNVEESLKSLVEETDKAFDIVAKELKQKDEILSKKDEELTNSISFLRSNLDNEIDERKNADENLSNAIKLNLEQIEGVDNEVSNLSFQLEENVKKIGERISINEGEISRIDGSLTAEMSNRIDGDKELLEKTNKLALSIKEVYNYSKSKDEDLEKAINAETERAIAEEIKKISFTDLGNGRKAIVMDNNDLILGKDTNDGVYNIAMISKWNVVDLGTSSLPINLNTPDGVRPTVQEAGQSGEKAHKIAYLSDVNDAKAEMNSLVEIEKNRAISVEDELFNKLDNSVTSLTASIDNVNSSLSILSKTDTALNSRIDLISTSLNNFKESGIELVTTSELQYTLYVDGVNRGIIDIPKDNFLTDVYVSEGDKLHFVFAVGDKQSDIEVDITKYIDIYTAGDGLSVNKNKFSIVIEESEGFLTVSEKGLKLNGISDAISSAVLLEENRATAADNALQDAINAEASARTAADNALQDAINAEARARISSENILSNRLSNVENFEFAINANKENYQTLYSQLYNEIARSTNADNTLSSNISGLSSNISTLSTKIDKSTTDLSERIDGVDVSINNIISNISVEFKRVDSAITKNNNAISDERNRAISIENKKIDWTDLGNERKAIVLGNNDLLLGTNKDRTKTYNIAMISKWDVVDLGTSSLPINLNTPNNVRPTVQEAGQSGEEAHKIAYLSDFNGYATEEWVEDKGYLTSVPEEYATEEWVEGKGYLTSVPEEYATVDDVTAAVSDKVSETALNEAINGVNNNISSFISEEFEALKELVISLQLKVNELEGRMYTSQEVIDKVSSMKEGDVLNLKIFNDITIDSIDKLTIPQNSVLNLDMNGKMFTANTDDILFRVNGTLNIYGNGYFQGSTYVASVNENGTINVYDGSYNNEVTSFQANGGVINIENGTFDTYGETYGTRYTLNHVDAKKEVGLISVKGGSFVNYNPEKSESEYPAMNFLAEGYGVTISHTLDNKPVYDVKPIIDIETPESLTNIVSNLVNGESTYIKLVNDIELDGTLPMFINKGTSVILDLNNKTFTNKVAGRATIINDGEMIIKNGSIVNGNNTKQGGAAILNRSNMIIENGTFGSKEQRGAAVENKGNLIINGGTFSSLEKGNDNSNGWAYVFINRGEDNPLMTINNANVNGNVHGVFCAESGVINVNGGMYTMGDENLSTYYMCYVIDGTINLNGGTFNWTRGSIVNTPIYKDGKGEININEGANINW